VVSVKVFSSSLAGINSICSKGIEKLTVWDCEFVFDSIDLNKNTYKKVLNKKFII